MTRLVVVAATLTLLSAAPALAMSCCGGMGGKGTMMCDKSGMAMNQTGVKAKKGSCCCEGMAGKANRRRV